MLVIADWIQAIGFIMNFHWIKMGEVPVVATTANATCVAQGAFIELGDVAGAAWVRLVSLKLFSAYLLSRHSLLRHTPFLCSDWALHLLSKS